MPARDTSEIKNKIVEFLRTNGPSLPVKISRNVGMDTLFTSAFLSELLSEKKIKITNMKVGTSPVYFVEGTEKGLEEYSEYLKQKEKEAYLLLKENSFLNDEEQEPAIRVALREIKDFAFPFEENNKLFWRYYLIPKSGFKKEEIIPSSIISQVQGELEKENKKIEESKEEKSSEINNVIEKQSEERKEEIKGKEITKPDTKKELERILPTEESNTFQNPFAKKEEKTKKEKPKSEFVTNVISFIKEEEMEIVKEISHKAKEFNFLTKIESKLGPMTFYTIAKDKKTVTENDLTKILGESQSIPLPALFLSTGELNKKAKEFLDKFTSVLKFKKID